MSGRDMKIGGYYKFRYGSTFRSVQYYVKIIRSKGSSLVCNSLHMYLREGESSDVHGPYLYGFDYNMCGDIEEMSEEEFAMLVLGA